MTIDEGTVAIIFKSSRVPKLGISNLKEKILIKQSPVMKMKWMGRYCKNCQRTSCEPRDPLAEVTRFCQKIGADFSPHVCLDPAARCL